MAYRSNTTGRPVLASLCAGPVFLFLLSLGMLILPNDGSAGPTVMMFAAPFAVFIGFIVAIIPNVACTAAMIFIGRTNEATRLPAFWGLVGALLAGATAAIATAPAELIALFAGTGAVSAFMCRIGVEWPDRAMTSF